MEKPMSDHDNRSSRLETPENPNRRLLLGSLAAAVGAAAIGGADTAPAKSP